MFGGCRKIIDIDMKERETSRNRYNEQMSVVTVGDKVLRWSRGGEKEGQTMGQPKLSEVGIPFRY